MIDGHQLVAIKLSDGLHIIDPGMGKAYERTQIDGVCKVGENIDAVGHNQKDYVISAILKPSEYNNIKTYKQMENLYLQGGFNAGINKIKEKTVNKIIANQLFQSKNE